MPVPRVPFTAPRQTELRLKRAMILCDCMKLGAISPGGSSHLAIGRERLAIFRRLAALTVDISQ